MFISGHKQASVFRYAMVVGSDLRFTVDNLGAHFAERKRRVSGKGKGSLV